MNTKDIDLMMEKYRSVTQEVFSAMGFSIDIAQAVDYLMPLPKLDSRGTRVTVN